jgi:Tfp pilus assembly protein PilF
VSLLLEALKKAELAKQQGTGGPQAGESAPAAPAAGDAAGGLSLEPLGAASAGEPLMTRDKLPDITQPLEIFTEDLAPPGGRASGAATTPGPGSAAAAPARPAPAERSASQPTEDMERNSARQLFESKMGDHEPRRPFYFLLGALGVATLGIVGYFAYQVIAPRPSFYTGPAAGKSAPPPATISVAPATPATPAAPEAMPSPAAPATQPAEPPAPTAQASAPASAVPIPPQPTQGSSAPRSGPASRAPGAVRAAASASAAGAVDPAASRQRAPVTVTASGPRVDPGVERGWEALQAGDLARATDEYTRALSANPRDRDALLGLAAIDVRNVNFASAEARYLKVLELDPRDAYAQAALLSLRGGGEAGQSESRLKTLIAQQPEASVLSFALGNQYASQRRWPEAQQAYFSAVSADPDNADYAYNLAVSLDHLRQPKLALEYYQRALALAGNRPVGFNTAQVQARVRELQR